MNLGQRVGLAEELAAFRVMDYDLQYSLSRFTGITIVFISVFEPRCNFGSRSCRGISNYFNFRGKINPKLEFNETNLQFNETPR